MSNHTTTTFSRICELYDEERHLLAQAGEWSDENVARQIAEIRAELAKLWPKERAERVFAAHGLPRLISDNRPMPHGRPRQVAYGIAPLPNGGD